MIFLSFYIHHEGIFCWNVAQGETFNNILSLALKTKSFFFIVQHQVLYCLLTPHSRILCILLKAIRFEFPLVYRSFSSREFNSWSQVFEKNESLKLFPFSYHLLCMICQSIIFIFYDLKHCQPYYYWQVFTNFI